MKLLQNKTNVVAPDAVYPFGDLKDDTGSNDGTPADRELVTDIHQFFEKLFDESGLTANGLPDNVTNGFQLHEAFKVFVPFRTKVLPIGVWDMDATASVTIAHGIDFTKIRKASVIIRDDANIVRVFLNEADEGAISVVDATNVTLARTLGGVFDATAYDDIAVDRGFLTIEYDY